jgi:uncharacterized protein
MPFWHTIIIEPSQWLGYCFFQPSRFHRELEARSRSIRLKRMLRLALPLFLFTYPFALIMRFILGFSYRETYRYYYSGGLDQIHLLPFLFDTVWVCLLTLAAAIAVGTLVRLSYGISGGITTIFWTVVSVRTVIDSPDYQVLTAVVVIVLGLVMGIIIGSTKDLPRRGGPGSGLGNLFGLISGYLCGSPIGLGVAYSVGVSLHYQLVILSNTQKSVLSSILSAFLSGAAGALVAGILSGLVRGNLRAKIPAPGIERALSVGMAMCITVSAVIGGAMGTAYGGYGEKGFAIGFEHYILPNIFATPLFIICYMLGYYRLPLYPVSGIASLLAYRTCKKQAQRTLVCLQHSPLYWDEDVFLPLPGLRKMLAMLAESQTDQALEIITFIIAQRPSQTSEALPVLREVVLNDLAARSTIQLIGQASAYLTKVMPQEVAQLAPSWRAALSRLEDASLEAARFCLSLGYTVRQDALNQMIYHLNRVSLGSLGDTALTSRLGTVVEVWKSVAWDELHKLQQAPQETGHLDNPYICGPALRASTPQFVGRRDLVQQIERALSKGVYRPCFFLTGERRMGKTSALNQLPNLLGARYLPIIFDLQLRGISSSAAAFLYEISRAISTVSCARGLQVNKLEYAELNEAQHENEAAVYRYFDSWLQQVEGLLQQEDRTILLAFDEFEKLEEARKQGYLDFHLLLDWFRSVIQNRPRLALLFSGVKTLGEMEGDWSSHFVNVQTLRVSFLAPVDARRLITQPLADYPGAHIFGPGVVEEIMRVTGRHPFLIQCVCYNLVEMVNDEGREQAALADIRQARKRVLSQWQDTYFLDLWNRTTPEQRACLLVLLSPDPVAMQQIVARSQLGEQAVQDALQALCQRDLLLSVGHSYRIAIPLFQEWIAQQFA